MTHRVEGPPCRLPQKQPAVPSEDRLPQGSWPCGQPPSPRGPCPSWPHLATCLPEHGLPPSRQAPTLCVCSLVWPPITGPDSHPCATAIWAGVSGKLWHCRPTVTAECTAVRTALWFGPEPLVARRGLRGSWSLPDCQSSQMSRGPGFWRPMEHLRGEAAMLSPFCREEPPALCPEP